MHLPTFPAPLAANAAKVAAAGFGIAAAFSSLWRWVLHGAEPLSAALTRGPFHRSFASSARSPWPSSLERG